MSARLDTLDDEDLLARSQTRWGEYRFAKGMEEDPSLPMRKTQEWRKRRRNAGARLHRVIEETDRRGLPKPWNLDEKTRIGANGTNAKAT